jgi:hypothetical protein
MKAIAKNRVKSLYTGQTCLDRITNSAADFADVEHTWSDVKKQFFHNTNRLDSIRNEDFFSAFPELKPLQDLEQ